MSLAHKYDEFSDDYSETDDKSSSDIATESDLQLFENGYQAGWQDAVTALQVEKEEGIHKAAQVLEEITFTNSEARRQILNSVSELLQSIFANRECHELCVSEVAHAGFRYGHALKRSSNMIAN